MTDVTALPSGTLVIRLVNLVGPAAPSPSPAPAPAPSPSPAPSPAPVASPQWLHGLGVPSPLLGVDTNYYVDDASLLVYRKAAGIWVSQGSLAGNSFVGLDGGSASSVYAFAPVDGGNADGTLTGFISTATTDMRPRYGVGAANAYTSLNVATLFASMLDIPSSANGSRVGGPFTTAPSAGQYGWVAVLSSAGSSGVTFTSALGTGGWNGAGLAGNYTGTDSSISPNNGITYVDTTGTYVLFRQDFAGSGDTFSIS